MFSWIIELYVLIEQDSEYKVKRILSSLGSVKFTCSFYKSFQVQWFSSFDIYCKFAWKIWNKLLSKLLVKYSRTSVHIREFRGRHRHQFWIVGTLQKQIIIFYELYEPVIIFSNEFWNLRRYNICYSVLNVYYIGIGIEKILDLRTNYLLVILVNKIRLYCVFTFL